MASSIKIVPYDQILRPKVKIQRTGFLPYTWRWVGHGPDRRRELYWLMGRQRIGGAISDFGGGVEKRSVKMVPTKPGAKNPTKRVIQWERPLECGLRELDEESSGLLPPLIQPILKEALKLDLELDLTRSNDYDHLKTALQENRIVALRANVSLGRKKIRRLNRYLVLVPIPDDPSLIQRFRPNKELGSIDWFHHASIALKNINRFHQPIRVYIECLSRLVW